MEPVDSVSSCILFKDDDAAMMRGTISGIKSTSKFPCKGLDILAAVVHLYSTHDKYTTGNHNSHTAARMRTSYVCFLF